MIVEYIRYRVADPQSLVAAYEKARAALDGSLHCLAYELSVAAEDAQSFVLRIEWDSAEGHLRGFRASPAFAEFLAAVGPHLPEIQEMRHYALTAIAARKSA
jgi:quinol monooxygenase YgiN